MPMDQPGPNPSSCAGDSGTIILGGTIVTMDDASEPSPEAVLIQGRRIAAVGSEREIRARAGSSATEVNLHGRALLPGFIDAHHHLAFAALDRRAPDLHLPAGASVADLLAIVKEHAAGQFGSGWVRLHGYSPIQLREGRHPTRRELDTACPDRPLLVAAYNWHEGALNSAGFDAMGWGRGAVPPPDGALPLGKDGIPLGSITEGALFLAEAQSRNSLLENAEDAWIAEMHAHCEDLLRAGITRLGDAAVSPTYDRLYERAVAAQMLPITVHRMPVAQRYMLGHRSDGSATGTGPSRSPIGAVKLFLDGAEECSMCYTTRQLLSVGAQIIQRGLSGGGWAALGILRHQGRPRRRADHLFHQGRAFWDDDSLAAEVSRAATGGHQVALHAIGNSAIDQAVRAIRGARARLEDPPGLPRIEHAVFLDRSQARQVADAGISTVVQPIWIREIGDLVAEISIPRPLLAFPFQTLVSAGVELAGSSDYPVASYDVLAAIETAVMRRTSSGVEFLEDEALTVTDAVRAYTMGAARALGADGVAGSIVAGKDADLVELDRNPLDTAPSELSDINVIQTYVAGQPTLVATP